MRSLYIHIKIVRVGSRFAQHRRRLRQGHSKLQRRLRLARPLLCNAIAATLPLQLHALRLLAPHDGWLALQTLHGAHLLRAQALHHQLARELIQLLARWQQQAPVGLPACIGLQALRDGDAHTALPVGGQGVYAQPELVALCLLQQSRINLSASHVFKHLPALGFFYRHGITPNTIYIQRKAGHFLPGKQRELQLPFQHAVVGVVEMHFQRGARHFANHLALHVQARQPHGLLRIGHLQPGPQHPRCRGCRGGHRLLAHAAGGVCLRLLWLPRLCPYACGDGRCRSGHKHSCNRAFFSSSMHEWISCTFKLHHETMHHPQRG